jgi:hypothetical protein
VSDTLQCYWCGHHPVELMQDCPKCGEHLTFLVPPGWGHGLYDILSVKANKDLYEQEDARFLALCRDHVGSTP